MNEVLIFILGLLQIMLLDLVLCGDNVGVIALATRRLSDDYAKKANLLGITFAVLLRIFFACVLTLVMSIQWLPLKLIGGLLLVKITWDLIKPHQEEKCDNVKQSQKFLAAVATIVIADLSMSIDNVLAIASAARGNIWLIIFGLVFNIPIIFFCSQIVIKLMKRYPIVIYIGAAVLARTSFNMILEDGLVSKYVPYLLSVIIPFIIAAVTIVYGIIIIKRNNPKASDNKMAVSREPSEITKTNEEVAASSSDKQQ